MKLLSLFKHTFLIIIFFTELVLSQGKVYLVLGSDTAIWSGMDVSRYHCYYNLSLYTAPSSNTTVVMSETFRNQILDSYGNKLKMTWWMMAGNIFRYATNNNVPVSNTMTLYLMKKYFGDNIEFWGDELSLHYHTFFWSDYDGDGKYWWNQSKTFLESKDDFDFTLAQYLLEENVFPVSFRSGWHFMDNGWQNYLNEILPYSLHNDYPAKRTIDEEPIDNIFDWSMSSPEFVPFNPAPENYQLQGNSKSWNVRSKYMGSVTQQMMNDIFLKASQGTDQLACFWSHLPEANFNDEIQQVNILAHQAELTYPTVKFQYLTAIEAYQLWLESNDNVKPQVQLTEEVSGADVKFVITTDEPIFQQQPFIAIKDRYERYFVAECETISLNTWRTISSFSLNDLGKVGVAVTDTVGNLSTSFKKYLPDDKFIDNNDPQYQEIYGTFNTSTTSAWNLDSRYATLNQNDSAKVRWNLETEQSGLYNIFIQFPEISNQVDTLIFEIFQNGTSTEKFSFINPQNYNQWLYVKTLNLNFGENNYIEMSTKNNNSISNVFVADVLKSSAFVRDKQLIPEILFVDIGELSIEDSLFFDFQISNAGINTLSVSNVYSKDGNIAIESTFPVEINGMSKIDLPLIFIPDQLGFIEDTIIIQSDDPINPLWKIPFTVNVLNYFTIVDNDDPDGYEETGSWSTSVAQAYGPSSRYALIQSTPNGPTASFTVNLSKNGIYDIYEILPKTENSANNALYKISKESIVIDSLYLNQNEGSGSWKNIGRYYLPAETQITIKVIDSGESTLGPVIRADAFKIALFQEVTSLDDKELSSLPTDFKLEQNYPNPFNPSTIITFQIPEAGLVSLKVYDLLGREVATLVDEHKTAGSYDVEFNASELSSGVYFYKLITGSSAQVKKMIYLR